MDKVKFFDEKKFMWDSRTYSESEALKIKTQYENDNFDTRLVREEESYFLFTRRIVTEVEIDKV